MSKENIIQWSIAVVLIVLIVALVIGLKLAAAYGLACLVNWAHPLGDKFNLVFVAIFIVELLLSSIGAAGNRR